MQQPDQAKFYGTATVSERGQIAIPAEARRDFDINVSEKLLVIAHPGGQGIALIKASALKQTLNHMMAVFNEVTEAGASQQQK
ncbi:MAG: AbrB/MazE/SpoVT family DNA-binding domain-containing protein [Chloroflexi bacterium]|jgi:AbrB family looped-hinge helix DNA binding protein|nr:AbrB/MazE/SpoVT family DNA-binding domain-containing protein [Chloroflexota bacterium]MBT7081086.1 AbrB/MazE/SpoVT family DNA-binding domain-containing protein [Chloroflexota bacterium]MBT7289477.1 AbrB/MazE/SpoVT family DNA-binding domain-containing protein [Chloroflexota bacterium]